MQNAPDYPQLLTKIEAAEFLKIRPRTLDSWLKARRVPFVKLGSARNATVRFKPTDLADFIDACRVETGNN